MTGKLWSQGKCDHRKIVITRKMWSQENRDHTEIVITRRLCNFDHRVTIIPGYLWSQGNCDHSVTVIAGYVWSQGIFDHRVTVITGVIDNMGLPIRARHCGGYFPVRSTGTLCGLMGCTIPGAFVFIMTSYGTTHSELCALKGRLVDIHYALFFTARAWKYRVSTIEPFAKKLHGVWRNLYVSPKTWTGRQARYVPSIALHWLARKLYTVLARLEPLGLYCFNSSLGL